MADYARKSDIWCCHENEKGIYGDIDDRCLEILTTFEDKIKGIFDPANFIQCGQDTAEAWQLLGHRVYYMHIKDALPDGTVVPAGMGVGRLPELIRDYAAQGGEAVSVEPHLRVFQGFEELEKDRTEPVRRFAYPTSDAAFDAACAALKALL